MTRNRTWSETRRGRELMSAWEASRAREARDTAETLLEDRGPANARAWVEHCMVRDPTGGFWRAVLEELARLEGAGR